jgi:hypothetical protein
MSTQADRASPYGFDVAIGPTASGDVDMTTDGRSCSGVELVRNSLVGRCMADVIPMIGAPGGFVAWGKDVRSWVGSPMSPEIATRRQQELALVFGRDNRVDKSSIVVTVAPALAGSAYRLTIAVSLRLTDTSKVSFTLGVTASDVTVDNLAQQGASQ